jgi:cytochrome c-type biogenesis protein CcmH/NrfG
VPVITRFILPCLLAAAAAAQAAPFVPSSDSQVLERLPERAADPRARELRALRSRLAANPNDADGAARLARAYFDLVAAEGDPRYIGYAQAALAPWWSAADAPDAVRVARALLRQFNHDFDAALADLRAVTARTPGHGEAWAWQAAIAMVQARYEDARRACAATAEQASPLIVTACTAAADALTGRAAPAAAALRGALAAAADASLAERLWALTRLAEIEERRGEFAAAEAAFREALSLGLTDGYLQAAYADFLLDRGRAPEVLVLLKDRERSDLLLLRLALAAKTTGAPELAKWQADLAARFDAARRRGDATHEKEESRFVLAFGGDTARALALAQRNFAVQREPADARALLEAALASGQRDAAAPALEWMDRNGVESVVLRALAARLKGGR